MTDSNLCPAWCSDKYPADDPLHIHGGPLMAVPVGHAAGIARLDLPSILVRATLPDYPADAQPFLLVLTTASSASGAHVLRRDAEGLAAVIDTLAAATPEQHREVAGMIREAAALIAGEASADD